MADRGHGPGARAGTTRHEMSASKVATAALHVGGLSWASEKAVVERVLGRRPGVRLVEADPVSQTATVTFDAAQMSVAELRRWVEECGYHCAGQSVPSHASDPMAEPDPADGHHAVSAGEGMPSAHEMVVAGGLPEREILRLAAAVERESEHPLAEAVVAHADGRVFPSPAPRGSRTSRAMAPWPGWTARRWPSGTPVSWTGRAWAATCW